MQELNNPVPHTNFFDAYASWTDSVAQYPPTAEPFYLALGIADEVGEYASAEGHEHLIAEAGDVLWYAARYARNVLGVPFSDVVADAQESRGSTQLMTALVGVICGVEKKRIRDGDQWSADKLTEKNNASYAALVAIINRLNEEVLDMGVTLQEVLERNMKKLGARLQAGTIRGDGEER